MAERLYHLNCGTLYPASAQFLATGPRPFRRGEAVCHCLLLETPTGLVLIDTGFGRADIADPRRLGRAFLAFARPALDPAETAVAQVRRLGFAVEDVRHIVLTHLDLDHTGGLADFSAATVHVYDLEYRSATTATGLHARRYQPAHWAHGPAWMRHGFAGAAWFGFDAMPLGGDLGADLCLIALPGHSRGHCGVALNLGDRWYLHCGDAYYDRAELSPGRAAPLLGRAARLVLHEDRAAVRRTLARLAALAAQPPAPLTLLCTHDPAEFARLANPA